MSLAEVLSTCKNTSKLLIANWKQLCFMFSGFLNISCTHCDWRYRFTGFTELWKVYVASMVNWKRSSQL